MSKEYNFFKDPWTLVTLTIIILSSIFYVQMKNSITNEQNFEETCMNYITLREYWIKQNPGRIPTLEEVFSLQINDLGNIEKVSPTNIAR